MNADLLILAAIGIVAGTFGGLLGIGGSIFIIPALTILFGPDQHLYQGAAMMVNFFVIWPSLIQHHRARAILPPIIKAMIPAAIIGVVLGVWFSSQKWFQGDNEVYLSRIFGAFLLYEAAYNVYRLFSKYQLPDIDPKTAAAIPVLKPAILVGFPMGLVGGLLGIG